MRQKLRLGTSRLSFALGVALVLVWIGGCGDTAGSHDGSDTAAVTLTQTPALTKAEFIKQADALCEEARDRVDREFNNLLTRENSDPPVKTVRIATRNFGMLIDQIGSLEAPPSDEKEINAFLDTLQRRLNFGRAHPTRFLDHPPMTGCADSLY
jgi:hypothetical protein